MITNFESKRKKNKSLFKNSNVKSSKNITKIINQQDSFFYGNKIDLYRIKSQNSLDNYFEEIKRKSLNKKKFSSQDKKDKLNSSVNSLDLSLLFNTLTKLKDNFLQASIETLDNNQAVNKIDLTRIVNKEKYDFENIENVEYDNDQISNNLNNSTCLNSKDIEDELNILRTPYFFKSFDIKENHKLKLLEDFSLDETSINKSN